MTEQICIMTSVHRHDDVRIYHKEAKALRQKGFSVTILCPDYAGTDENGIRFVRVPMPKIRCKRFFGIGTRTKRNSLCPRANAEKTLTAYFNRVPPFLQGGEGDRRGLVPFS